MLTSNLLLQQSSGFTWTEMKLEADALCFTAAVGGTLKSSVCIEQKPCGMDMTYRKKQTNKLRLGDSEHFSIWFYL